MSEAHSDFADITPWFKDPADPNTKPWYSLFLPFFLQGSKSRGQLRNKIALFVIVACGLPLILPEGMTTFSPYKTISTIGWILCLPILFTSMNDYVVSGNLPAHRKAKRIGLRVGILAISIAILLGYYWIILQHMEGVLPSIARRVPLRLPSNHRKQIIL